MSLKLAHFAELIQEYCHLMPFDKKLACLTNYQERRSFPWPLVDVYVGESFAKSLAIKKMMRDLPSTKVAFV